MRFVVLMVQQHTQHSTRHSSVIELQLQTTEMLADQSHTCTPAHAEVAGDGGSSQPSLTITSPTTTRQKKATQRFAP
jgi:hypothetical protein